MLLQVVGDPFVALPEPRCMAFAFGFTSEPLRRTLETRTRESKDPLPVLDIDNVSRRFHGFPLLVVATFAENGLVSIQLCLDLGKGGGSDLGRQLLIFRLLLSGELLLEFDHIVPDQTARKAAVEI